MQSCSRTYGDAAIAVINQELQQMLDKQVWTPVSARDLSIEQHRALMRSSMFLKAKHLPSGAFDKLKVRHVAGGNQQDKLLYPNLSASTAATSSVFIIAAIAASWL
jgi:hypothetical protein